MHRRQFRDEIERIINQGIKHYEKNFSDEEINSLIGDFIHLKVRKEPKFLHEWIDLCQDKIQNLDQSVYDTLLDIKKQILDKYDFEDLENIYSKIKETDKLEINEMKKRSK